MAGGVSLCVESGVDGFPKLRLGCGLLSFHQFSLPANRKVLDMGHTWFPAGVLSEIAVRDAGAGGPAEVVSP